MNTTTRQIKTGLTGPVSKEILLSVMGQLSDGMWENSPAMSKYWRNAEIAEMADGSIVIQVSDSWGSGFQGKDDEWIRSWFASKIKQVVQDNLGRWDRRDATVLDYMGRHVTNEVTASQAYRAYDTLKGRDTQKFTYAS